MDGWESRRKRTPGNDWCVIKLGTPGVIRGVDIDTNHFLGNHPPHASIEALCVERDPAEGWESAAWVPLLPQSALQAGSQNLFPIDSDQTWTHVRLSIYPDGGVARLHVYGDVQTTWSHHPDDEALAARLEPGEVDLVAARNGGLALTCSDMFFSPMNNVILPGRGNNMGEGWETRRRRDDGNDWMILRLGAPGTLTWIEVDTHHFKGNYPNQCSLEGVSLPHATAEELRAKDTPWTPVLAPTPLAAHQRHHFRQELLTGGPFTHVRFSIFPDGGVSRLRLYGLRGEDTTP
jgi:allantoicase